MGACGGHHFETRTKNNNAVKSGKGPAEIQKDSLRTMPHAGQRGVATSHTGCIDQGLHRQLIVLLRPENGSKFACFGSLEN